VTVKDEVRKQRGKDVKRKKARRLGMSGSAGLESIIHKRW
jgi:hypothetical protein